MSRYIDHSDDDSPDMVLARGRWQRNARAVLKSTRGRKALTAIRAALLALPEKRLIEGALCTVGGPDRVPEVTEAEIDAHVARLKEAGGWDERYHSRERAAKIMRLDREKERDAITENTGARGQGCGVCVNGALLWHRLVQEGLDPDEAFAALPSIAGSELGETALITEKDAGIAYTLAWELAYRNDETYRRITPEERWTAFLTWIEELSAVA